MKRLKNPSVSGHPTTQPPSKEQLTERLCPFMDGKPCLGMKCMPFGSVRDGARVCMMDVAVLNISSISESLRSLLEGFESHLDMMEAVADSMTEEYDEGEEGEEIDDEDDEGEGDEDGAGLTMEEFVEELSGLLSYGFSHFDQDQIAAMLQPAMKEMVSTPDGEGQHLEPETPGPIQVIAEEQKKE